MEITTANKIAVTTVIIYLCLNRCPQTQKWIWLYADPYSVSSLLCFSLFRTMFKSPQWRSSVLQGGGILVPPLCGLLPVHSFKGSGSSVHTGKLMLAAGMHDHKQGVSHGINGVKIAEPDLFTISECRRHFTMACIGEAMITAPGSTCLLSCVLLPLVHSWVSVPAK